MPEAPKRFGSFEVLSLLGKGGMGEVYRARDTKLGRDVALKFLPVEFAADRDRMARFEREARLLASLNHPNIATLHGMEESGGKHFLVMELVEGETLAERIRRGPLDATEAFAIARQMAEALEAAHEKSIVHRDLKPANVKVTPEGKVKVLDFGLAKASQYAPSNAALSNSPTLSMGATQAGVILGTAAYMSPEQAKGTEADTRSDIFSFGSVLYEMLTGRQVFQGETVSEIIAAVLIREPDLNTLPPGLNPRIADLLRRCLSKNPRQRWQAAGDLRAEVEMIAAAPHASPIITPSAAKPRPLWRRAIPVLVTAVVFSALAGFAGWRLRSPDPVPVTRFPLVLPDGQLMLTAVASHPLAISPDGTRLVYLANGQLFLRSMSEMEARPIAGKAATEPGQAIAEPFFSPDGQWIGYYAREDATLKKISVTGGAPVTLCKTDSVSGATWDGDQIFFARLRGKGIMKVSANGGEPQEVVARGPDEVFHGPQLFDGGRWLLFTVTTEQGEERWDKAQIVAQSLQSGERKVLLRGGSDARYLPTGHLVYALGTTLFAAPLDIKKMQLQGNPVPVLEGVMRASPISTAAAHFAFSTTGSLVYVPGAGAVGLSRRMLAFVDRNGKAKPLPLPAQSYLHPRISPDGKQLVYGTDDGQEGVIWVLDLRDNAQPRRLTFGGRNLDPIWSPDSKSIAFQSNREGEFVIYRQHADASGSAERLTKANPGSPGGVSHVPESWSPDGRTLIYRSSAVGNNVGGLTALSMDGDKKESALFQSLGETLAQANTAFSPDGHWLAYDSNEPDGRGYHVFVQPFPPTGAKYQIPEIGMGPIWSPDGKQLLYAAGNPGTNRMVAVDVRTTPTFTFGPPTPVQIAGLTGNTGIIRHYDMTPDGKGIIAVLDVAATQAASGVRQPNPQINVVLNWFIELKQRSPVR